MLSSLKLLSATPLGKEEIKKLNIILQNITDRNESYDFQFPVDWKALQLTDYTFIIKHPMDLGTIRNKLQEQKYKHLEEVLDDIQLVWDNCKTYNAPQTWIYKTAESLQRSFKKMVKNYLPNVPITIPGRQNVPGKQQKTHQNMFEEEEADGQVNYHEKMKFAEKLRHLSSKQLGDVVQRIIDTCPSAININEHDNNAQLMVDNLNIQIFHEICGMVERMNDEEQLKKKIKAD